MATVLVSPTSGARRQGRKQLLGAALGAALALAGATALAGWQCGQQRVGASGVGSRLAAIRPLASAPTSPRPADARPAAHPSEGQHVPFEIAGADSEVAASGNHRAVLAAGMVDGGGYSPSRWLLSDGAYPEFPTVQP
jgi:hypothetical protein